MTTGIILDCTQWLAQLCSLSPVLMGASLGVSIAALYWVIADEY